ncbi:response regulator transcription factor [Spongiactinospora rosea]|uniref:response regulator transcription factor n=1 Tax=Spongiactinospora rosea TaxID=2248750 RepID=UPI0011C06580|nr:response regulator transcription factor [Spongiactinospora rosea]
MALLDESSPTSEPPAALRVVVGEQDRDTRARLRSVLHMGNGIFVLGEATAAPRLDELIVRHRPMVAVVNATLRQADDVEFALALAARSLGRTRVVLVSETLDEDLLGRALQSGTGGFVHREALLREILPAIRQVAAGLTFISSTMITRLRDRFPAVINRVGHRLTPLTRREAEVLALVAAGLSNLQIADKLGIGAGTVRSHLARILAKLSARNRAHAVGIAYESGLLTVGSPRRR